MTGEINTLVSDYVLAAVTAALAWRLGARRDGHASRGLWALALGALAFGAFTGGSYHGFRGALPPAAVWIVWKVTVVAIGVGAAAMIAGSAAATAGPRLLRALRWIALSSFAIYALWMLFHNAYIFVVGYTALAMALIAALHAWALGRGDLASRWMLSGVAVSALAAAAQASGFDPHPRFNHNDLYHAIQVGAMLLFYAGATRLRDRDHGAR